MSKHYKRKKKNATYIESILNVFQKIELEKPFNGIITDKRINYVFLKGIWLPIIKNVKIQNLSSKTKTQI